MATAEKKKPVQTFGSFYSSGSYIEVAVWQNEIEVNGKSVTVYAVSFSRSYKDNGKFKKSQSLRVQDIPVLQYALGKAYDWIMSQKHDRDETPDEAPDESDF